VISNREIAPSVFELAVSRDLTPSYAALSSIPAPVPGQFFMLRSRPSGVLLGRPISVYRFGDTSITFMILKKGRGTVELCGLRAGDSVDLVGPIGNRFMPPAELHASGALPLSGLRVAVIGGGIGVAPVAGFALSTLEAKTFDFYASFRSVPYGLDGIEARANRLVITTEDGSAGVKGMLPSVFEASQYDLVYACGPTPMLRYVKEACASAPRVPLTFVSLEEHMACGAGACLGCTVRTTAGNKRCCVDGPVFDASEVTL
jgi:NAD(P)H-flavin reductase